MSFLIPECDSVTAHMKHSYGGTHNPLNHYGTTYNIQYGRRWVHRDLYRKPEPGGNFMWSRRSCLGYSTRLDDIDNPWIKPFIQRNYLTVTKRDFVGTQLPYRPNAFYNTHKPIMPAGYDYHTELNAPKIKHDPKDWRTTYSLQYDNKPPRSYDYIRDPIGRIEESGFTMNNPIVDSLTRRPQDTYCTSEITRPTGEPLYKSNYQRYTVPTGKEPIPNIAVGSDRSSAFVKCNLERPQFVPTSQEIGKPQEYSPEELAKLKKTDPAEYFNAIYPNKDPSVTHATYKDPGKIEPTKEEILNKVKVGGKEPCGFVSNQDRFIEDKTYPDQFVTQYMTSYYDPTYQGAERNGHINFNMHDILPDGFVKNNEILDITCEKVMHDHCESPLDAYQSRSTTARNFVDNVL